MTGLLAAITLATLPALPLARVEDFFPLEPGTKWHYQEQGAPGEVLDEVLEPVVLDGKKATPIRTSMGGNVLEVRYFRVEGDTVWLIGNKPDVPLPAPHPVLKIGDKASTWTFDGVTGVGKDGHGISFQAQTTPKGAKKLFGQDRTRYEMVLNADLEQGEGINVRIKQVTTYAEGIGWVEMKQTVSYRGQSKESTTRLVRFEKPSR